MVVIWYLFLNMTLHWEEKLTSVLCEINKYSAFYFVKLSDFWPFHIGIFVTIRNNKNIKIEIDINMPNII